MNIKYFCTVVMTVFLSFVSLEASAIWIHDVKIKHVNFQGNTIFLLELHDLNGNMVTGPSGGQCVFAYNQVWASMYPDQEQLATGISNPDHFKMLYSLASAALLAGNTVSVYVTVPTVGGPCYLTGLQVEAD